MLASSSGCRMTLLDWRGGVACIIANSCDVADTSQLFCLVPRYSGTLPATGTVSFLSEVQRRATLDMVY